MLFQFLQGAGIMGLIQRIQHQFAKVNMKDARLEKRAVEIAQGCAHPEKSLSGRFADWAGF
jgi:hypothetical protein